MASSAVLSSEALLDIIRDPKPILWEDGILRETIDFSGLNIHFEVNFFELFRQAGFQVDGTFIHCLYAIRFKNANFLQAAIFNSCCFYNAFEITACTFKSGFECEKSSFKGDTSFTLVTFQNVCLIQENHFEKLRFKQVDFNSWVYFDDSRFKKCDFIFCNFKENTSFRYIANKSKTKFIQSVFYESVDFSYSDLYQFSQLLFIKSLFKKQILFENIQGASEAILCFKDIDFSSAGQLNIIFNSLDVVVDDKGSATLKFVDLRFGPQSTFIHIENIVKDSLWDIEIENCRFQKNNVLISNSVLDGNFKVFAPYDWKGLSFSIDCKWPEDRLPILAVQNYIYYAYVVFVIGFYFYLYFGFKSHLSYFNSKIISYLFLVPMAIFVISLSLTRFKKVAF
jgi:uncharacterized protein YjbI with pentapeptide repeats